jgi:short-subunit dehydrogenase
MSQVVLYSPQNRGGLWTKDRNAFTVKKVGKQSQFLDWATEPYQIRIPVFHSKTTAVLSGICGGKSMVYRLHTGLIFEFMRAVFKRTVLVTGGSSGIGAACVRYFLQNRWRVSVVALPDSNLDNLAGLDVLVTPGDLASHKTREAAVERTLSSYGRIDVLLNNAGIGLYACPTTVPMHMLSRLFDVNVIAPLAMAQLVAPIMRSQQGGAIVNVGSVAGRVSLPWSVAYSASKFALCALNDSLRRELKRDRIHVLEVCPGIVSTNFRNRVLAGTVPAEVARIAWSVSPDLVAARIYEAIAGRRNVIYVPRIGRLFAALDAIAPRLMDLYLSRYLPPRASISEQYSTETMPTVCCSTTPDES